MSLKAWLIKRQIRMQKDFLHDLSIDEIRQEVDRAWGTVPLPKSARVTEVSIDETINARWIKDQYSTTKQIILYFHGGGFCQGSSKSYQHSCYDIVAVSGIQMLVPDYRLAPEHPFPAAIYDSVTAYDYLIGLGFSPKNICIVADSAGASLALGLISTLIRRNATLPVAMGLLSPCVTVEMYHDSQIYRDLEKKDIMLSEKILRRFSAAYLKGHNPKDPLASPIYSDLTGYPPMFISVGTEDMLIDSIKKFYMRALDCKLETEFWVNDGCMHVHHLLGLYVPEAESTLLKLSLFLRKKLKIKLKYPHHHVSKLDLDKI